VEYTNARVSGVTEETPGAEAQFGRGDANGLGPGDRMGRDQGVRGVDEEQMVRQVGKPSRARATHEIGWSSV
jgi:hypothetical protein